MAAIAVEDGPDVARRALADEHLVLNATGPDTVRFLPPLTVADREIDDALERVARVVRSG
jgi:acetylornithine/N-succinyldiaminopimelate aminotransferase